jgi:NADH-quinone oxidoreductase subunit L
LTRVNENLVMVAVMPLLAALITAALGKRWLRHHSHWPALIALGYALIMAVSSLGRIPEGGMLAVGYDWVNVGGFQVGVHLFTDQLTAVMLCVVTFVAVLVAAFSVGYMHDDPGYPRFFAALCLFVFCMVMLLMARNFLLLYIFWEGVGLCSYLLIGFWFQKPAAAAAARKAFLVNRLGDFGLLLGLFLIWTNFGTLDMGAVFSSAPALGSGSWTLAAICLCLFVGAMGKSAQFPLHVWLPDAMEGPTPASALIHAATMVTAGVYLVARATPLYVLAPQVQAFVACIGAFTALLAALIALTQTDLKRVMAYSTVSQLGYMFLALGSAAGNPELANFAVVAAIFHLFTHAFFKALLFLASGSVMHAMGGVIDMRQFSGLRQVLPWTHLTFAVGALGLAGVPPLAGFFSKDEILLAVSAGTHGPYGGLMSLLLVLGLLTAFLTAFYTGRAYFLTFWGTTRLPPEAEHHAHEGPRWMVVPLFILAAGTAIVGWLLGPLTHGFEHYVGRASGLPAAGEHTGGGWVMWASILVAGSGVALAWAMYQVRPDLPGLLAARFRWAWLASLNKFYLDELYVAALVRPGEGLAQAAAQVDQHVVDGLVDAAGKAPFMAGQWFRPVQNGLVQFYALGTLLGLAVFLVALLLRMAG